MNEGQAFRLTESSTQLCGAPQASLVELIDRLLADLVVFGSASQIVIRFDFDAARLELAADASLDIANFIERQWEDWLRSLCASVALKGNTLLLEEVFDRFPVVQRGIRAQAGREASDLFSTVFRPWALLHPEVSWDIYVSGQETLGIPRHLRWSVPKAVLGTEPIWLLRMRQVLDESTTAVQYEEHTSEAAASSAPSTPINRQFSWSFALVRGFHERLWVFGWNSRPVRLGSPGWDLMAPIRQFSDSVSGIVHGRLPTVISSENGRRRTDPYLNENIHSCSIRAVESLYTTLRETLRAPGLSAGEDFAQDTLPKETRACWCPARPSSSTSGYGRVRPSHQRRDLFDCVLSRKTVGVEAQFALCEALGRPPAPQSRRGNLEVESPGERSTEATLGLEPRKRVSTRTLESLQTGWESDLFGTRKDCSVPILPEFSSLPHCFAASTATTELRTLDLEEARVIGQFDRKFIVFRTQNGVFLLDQHAADERVRFEHLSRLYRASLGHAERSLIPPNVSLRTPLKVNLGPRCLSTSMYEQLRRFGWSWEASPAGALLRGTMILRSVPCILGQQPLMEADDLLEFIDLMLETDEVITTVPAAERVLATLACRYAIMFGDCLEPAECEALLHRLAKCQLPFQCAHGRPSVAVLACPTSALPK
ncbi:hypothetical protein CCYA_CCYA06G1941 [Cyanidiococcus yangmingshanensis]|nr:hypothetical protein CCYA_CCYA06G1941 [Cyanidiococcus yangmingshanensis]